MILKLTREINREVQSELHTLAIMRYIRFFHTHLGIFFYFGKILFEQRK